MRTFCEKSFTFVDAEVNGKVKSGDPLALRMKGEHPDPDDVSNMQCR